MASGYGPLGVEDEQWPGPRLRDGISSRRYGGPPHGEASAYGQRRSQYHYRLPAYFSIYLKVIVSSKTRMVIQACLILHFMRTLLRCSQRESWFWCVQTAASKDAYGIMQVACLSLAAKMASQVWDKPLSTLQVRNRNIHIHISNRDPQVNKQTKKPRSHTTPNTCAELLTAGTSRDTLITALEVRYNYRTTN